MPSLSVVVASYQAARTLPRALDSVLAQSLPPDEIIVCNDGSTDDTVDVLQRYVEHIIAVEQPNQGLSAARNTAIRRASSDWIVLLDADDEWLPSRLERMADAISAHPEVDIVTTDAIVRHPSRPDTLWYRSDTWPEHPDLQPEAIIAGSFIFSGSAVRRSALEQVGLFRTDVGHQNEWEAWVRLILNGSRAFLVGDPLAIYHQSESGQLSRNRVGTYTMMLDVIEREQGRHGPLIDDAIQRSAAHISQRLRTAEGIEAIKRRDRRGCWQLAVHSELPHQLRLKFALAAVFPELAIRWLSQKDR